MRGTQAGIDLDAVRAELDAVDGHDWTSAAASWAEPLLEECAVLRGQLAEARAREQEARSLHRDIVRSAHTLAGQRAALAAELDKDRHEFVPHDSGADCCTQPPAGWPDSEKPPRFVRCGHPAAWSVHRTARVVLEEAGRS